MALLGTFFRKTMLLTSGCSLLFFCQGCLFIPDKIYVSPVTASTPESDLITLMGCPIGLIIDGKRLTSLSHVYLAPEKVHELTIIKTIGQRTVDKGIAPSSARFGGRRHIVVEPVIEEERKWFKAKGGDVFPCLEIPEEAKVEDTQEENVNRTVKKPKFSFEEVTSGKDLFNAPKSACSICHGKDADVQARDKKLMSALSFSPQPTDLRNPKAIRFWGREEIIRVISQGIPNTSMVPMMLPKGNLTIEEIEKIATFLEAIRY